MLRAVTTMLASCSERPCTVESATPRAMCRRAHDWRGLDRDEPSTDVSIVAPGAQAHRLRYRPSACRARAAKLVIGFTLETETAATCALLQVHAPTIRNAFRLASFYPLARRWFPSHRRRTHVPVKTDRGPLSRPASFRAQTGRHTPSLGRQYVRPAPIHSRSPHGHRQGCFREAPAS